MNIRNVSKTESIPTPSPREPQAAVDSSHGLPSNQVHKLAQDRYSRLWLAGPAGLSCYDGDIIRNFDRSNGLRCGGLRGLGVSADGTIWVGTDQGLEALDENGKPMPWASSLVWPYGLCEHIDAAGDAVWIGSASGLVLLEPVSADQAPRINYYADVGFVRHIARIDDRHVYAASDSLGLVESDGSSWNRVRCPELAGLMISRLVYGPGRMLLVGTEAGIFILDPETNEIKSHLLVPEASTEVTALTMGKNEWWVAFSDTLIALPFDAPERGATERFLLKTRINDLLVDSLGNVWIATDTGGLSHVNCLRNAIERVDMGNEGSVFTIRKGTADRYFIGGERLVGSISLSDSNGASCLEAPDGLPATTIWDSYEDEAGLWVASHDGLFYAAYGGEFERVFGDDPILGAPTRVILPRGDELLVGTLRGLARIRNGKAEEVVPSDGQHLGYVYALYIDELGILWAATLGRGLWREDGRVGGTLHPVIGGPLLASGNTYAVSTGPDGNTVVLQDEKIVLLDHEMRPKLLDTRYPVAGWTALWLDSQTLAIGSSEGLRLFNVETTSEQMLIRSLFGPRDWEFTTNRALLAAADGSLLCGVNGGLIRVDLEKLRSFLEPPEVRLTDISWRGVKPESNEGQYRVSPGPWTIQVRAFSAWFVDQESIRYRFKLVGFDDSWSSLQKRPKIAYNSLPPGTYSLQIQAHSPLTGYGLATTLCEVRVNAPWWTLGWASALAGVELFYDRLVRSRSRNRVLSERNKLLEQEVMERTWALRTANEELQRAQLEFESLSRTDSLTGVANRRRFDQRLENEIQRARRLGTPLSLIMVDIDYFKSINDSLGHQVGDEYLRAVAGVLLAHSRPATDTVARYGGEEFGIICAGTDAEEAISIGERFRAGVQALALINEASPEGDVTISVGVTAMTPYESITEKELIIRSDTALYDAKRNGRNQVMVMPEVDATPIVVAKDMVTASFT